MNISIRTSDGSTTVTVSDETQEITIQVGKGTQPTITTAPATPGRKADK